MGDLKIGVIGAGGRGVVAQYGHKPGEGSRVVAVCDTYGPNIEKAKGLYGADVYATEDYKALLKRDLDVVFVCTPDFLHEEHGLAALELGLPVYLEKPMAITIEGCDKVLRKAKEKKAKLFVGHNMRYSNVMKKMKKLIDDGAVGEVKSVWVRHFIAYGGDAYFRDWHSERKYSTGMLLQKASHDIDMMHWLTSANTKRVSAFGNLSVYDKLPRRKPEERGDPAFVEAHWPPMQQSGFSPKIDVEDQTVVIMEMEKQVLGSYQQCHFSPDSWRNFTVIGTEGRIENMGDKPDSPIFIWNKRYDTFRMIPDEVYRGETALKGSHGGADQLIVAEFLEHARTGAPTTATPIAARMSVATGCQATESLRNGGKPLDIPPIQW